MAENQPELPEAGAASLARRRRDNGEADNGASVASLTEEHRFLTKEAILGLDDRRYEEVFVEAWDAWVMLRGLSGSERDDWEASMIDQKEQRRAGQPATMVFAHMRAKLLVKCIVDPKTKTRLFRDTDVTALGEKSAAALQPLFEKAQILSALRDEDVEELTKNSSSEASAENGSASPPTSESP